MKMKIGFSSLPLLLLAATYRSKMSEKDKQ
jgi:hypothetical protein